MSARAFRGIAVAVALSCAFACVTVERTAMAQGSPRERANRLFAQGAEAYGAGHFADAVRAFREAYEALPAPPLLYNLARALEAAGDDAAAIDAYQRFLTAEPSSPDRPAVEASLTTLRARESDRRAREQAARDEAARRQRDQAAREQAAQRTALPPPPPESSGSSVPPWAVAGVGVLLLGGGAAAGAVAAGTYDRAVDEPVQQRASELATQANDLATIANILLVAGGVVAAGGAIWGIVDLVSSGGSNAHASRRMHRERAGGARVWIAPGAGSVMVGGRF